MNDTTKIQLSGARLRVHYRLAERPERAAQRARAICVEQTVEFPRELLPEGPIPERVVGWVESVAPAGDDTTDVVISYAVETAGDGDLLQLLNLVYGNISIQPGIRLERLDLPEPVLAGFPGPRFGRSGLRRLLGVPRRPLLCSAVKPMGLTPVELAEMAYQLALGGIDLVKDDHGLADQRFCPFDERVARCAEAVDRANRVTGGRCRYLPNLPGPSERLGERVEVAKRAGAGGLLVCPGLHGLDVMRRIACDDAVSLPILSHPALQGSYLVDPRQGISHFALFGQLHRLAGADGCIFPNAGGRFAFTPEDCRAIARGTGEPMGALRRLFPVPAGGMGLERVGEMVEFYGRDVILLIGGDLHRSDDLVRRCRELRRLVEG